MTGTGPMAIPDEALDDRIGIVGTAGSGKTYTAGLGVERILDRKGRVIIPDPLGVWYGLRSLADGRPSPYKVVIFGGPHGDLPINEHAGALIGETVAGMAESAIVDLSEFGTKASERRFMLAFLTALYRKANGEPVHLIFDEADMWAPERLLDKEGEAAKLLGMMETVVRRGRIKGFIPWLISQRPAVLSKNVLSQADGLIAMKLTSSQDRKALQAWVEGQADAAAWKDINAALPTLERGTGVVWLPSRGILETSVFPAKRTFDSSRTPKRGEAVRSAERAPIDLSALKDRLAAVEAEAKSNDPKALKAELTKAQSEIAQLRRGPVADPQAITAAREEGYSEGLRKGTTALRDLTDWFQERLAMIADAKLADVPTTIAAGREEAESMYAELATVPAEPTRAASRLPTPPPPVAKPINPPASDNGELPSGATSLLREACQRSPLRLNWTQLASLTGRKARGGSFNTARKRLIDGGYVVEEGDRVVPTDVGFLESGVVPSAMPVSVEDRLNMWVAALPGPSGDLLKIVYAEGPLTREALAEAAGRQPRGGSWNTALKVLRDNDLIVDAGGPITIGGALS